MRRIGFAILALSGTLLAQPKFEVVSIRPVPPNAPMVTREWDFNPVLPGGQFIDSRTALIFLIPFAFDVKNPAVQLLGLPDWAKEQGFSVAAKPAPGFPALPPAENREQVRLMMRALLADRFGLKVHTETRQEAVFHLEIAKGGARLKEVPAPVPPEKSIPVGAAMGNSGGRMIGSKSTVASLAGALALFLKRPVVDGTGLTGYYDFDIKWSAPEDGHPDSTGFGADGSAMLLSNLQSQLGLRLTKTNGPVEYWIVDHVERPEEN